MVAAFGVGEEVGSLGRDSWGREEDTVGTWDVCSYQYRT